MKKKKQLLLFVLFVSFVVQNEVGVANKVDAILDAIETKLAELVTAGAVRQVVRRPMNPATEKIRPSMSVVCGDLRRAGGPHDKRIWRMTVSVGILASEARASIEGNVVELIALADGKLEALDQASGTLGGGMDIPDWQFAYWPTGENTFARIGATASFRVTFEGPIAT